MSERKQGRVGEAGVTQVEVHPAPLAQDRSRQRRLMVRRLITRKFCRVKRVEGVIVFRPFPV